MHHWKLLFLLPILMACEGDGLLQNENIPKAEIVFPENSFRVGDHVYHLKTDSFIQNVPFGQLDPMVIEVSVTDTLNNYVFRPLLLKGIEHAYSVDSSGYKFYWFVDCYEGQQEAYISDIVLDEDGIEKDSVLLKITADVIKPSTGWYRSCLEFPFDGSDYDRLLLSNKEDLYIIKNDTLFHTDDPVGDDWTSRILPNRLLLNYIQVSPSGILYAVGVGECSSCRELYISEDKGYSWNQVENPGREEFFIDSNNVIYTCVDTNCYSSQDSGLTWNFEFNWRELGAQYSSNKTMDLIVKDGVWYILKYSEILKIEDKKLENSVYYPTPWYGSAKFHLQVKDGSAFVYTDWQHYLDKNYWEVALAKNYEISQEFLSATNSWMRIIENEGELYIGQNKSVLRYENAELSFHVSFPTNFSDFALYEDSFVGVGNRFYYLLE